MSAEPVANTSYTAPDGERVLQHRVVIPATQAQVWTAFTTTEGLKSFVAPIARIDLRIGGEWEASYNPAAKIGDPNNIVNEILSYLPIEMLSIRVKRTPPGFPCPEVGKSLWTVLQFRESGAREVEVIGTMLGWKEGADWDTVYDLFDRGNAHVLAALHRYLTENGS